jgi:hypothetical protein
MKEAMDALAAELESARTERDAKASECRRLRSELNGRRGADPNHDVAVQLFQFWQTECGHPQAKFGPKRQKAVLARLQDYHPRQIAYAIRGARLAAYTDEKGNRYDDLELICRDEVKLENFIARYQRRKQ